MCSDCMCPLFPAVAAPQKAKAGVFKLRPDPTSPELTSARCHPLHTTRADDAMVPQEILVLHLQGW
jgi:hypothetical protein